MVTAANNLEDYKLEEDCVLHCMGKPVIDGNEQQDTGVSDVAEAPSTTQGSTLASAIPVSLLQSVLSSGEMKRSVDSSTWNTALTTLQKMLNNIISNPNEEKYRKVKKGNSAFQKRVGSLSGSNELMIAAGFVEETIDGEAYYVILPSAEAWPKLLEAQANISAAISQSMPQFQPSMPVPPSLPTGTPFNASSNLDSMAMSMLQNPQALQSMLSNPMVQQQMMNDPRIASNPMIRRSLEELSRDPARLQQLSQMMSDPSTRHMLSQMANNHAGMAGNAPSFPQPTLSTGNTSPEQQNFQAQQLAQMARMVNNVNQNGSSGVSNNTINGSDTQMTEEEMINEAIARSLREM